MIRQPVFIHHVDTHARLHAVLWYDESEPLVVKMFVSDGGEEIVWEFSRDLLAAGTERLAGIGDVVIWPSHDPTRLKMTFSSPDGTATFTLSSEIVRRFVVRTYVEVPRGKEQVDVQSVIDKILA